MTRRAALIVAALCGAEAAAAFESAMVFAAIGKLIAVFGDATSVSWLITVFLLVGAGAAVIAGRLGDLLGRRHVALTLIGLAAIGSLISYFANGLPMMLVGRALQGMAAAVMPLSIGILRENFPAERRAPLVGIVLMGASAGVGLGLVLGGVIVDYLNWQAIFLAGAILSVVSFAAIALLVPRSPRAESTDRIDYLSGLLFLPGVGCLLLVISNGARWGWTGRLTLATAAIGLACLVAWAVTSIRSRNPLIDVRLFRSRTVLLTNLVTALAAMSTMQIILVFAALMQAPAWTGIGIGVTATLAGLAMIPSKLVALPGGPLSGWLTARHGGRTALLTGCAVAMTGWALLLVFHQSLLVVAALQCVVALGTMLLFASGPAILVNAVPEDRTSEAAGVMAVVRSTFIGIGAQVAGVLLATSTVSQGLGGARYPSAEAFELTIMVIIGLVAAAMLVAFGLPRGRHVTAPVGPVAEVSAAAS